MKKLITLFLTISLFSCNDGDFDVPEFEFTEDLNYCGEYVLYKTNSTSTEVLILTLSPSHLDTIAGETPLSIPTSVSVIYRIFNEGIDGTYFCQEIPPLTPTIVKELVATNGTVNILTTEILTDDVVTGYKHSITISDLLFNDVDERILFESFDFGAIDINL